MRRIDLPCCLAETAAELRLIAICFFNTGVKLQRTAFGKSKPLFSRPPPPPPKLREGDAQSLLRRACRGRLRKPQTYESREAPVRADSNGPA